MATNWKRVYSFDNWGNMWVNSATGMPLAGNAKTTNVYNPPTNRLNTASYDAAGNVLRVNGPNEPIASSTRQRTFFGVCGTVALQRESESGIHGSKRCLTRWWFGRAVLIFPRSRRRILRIVRRQQTPHRIVPGMIATGEQLPAVRTVFRKLDKRYALRSIRFDRVRDEV